MKPDFDPFVEDAERPSRLLLDRFAAGELKGPERSAVQQWIAKNPYAVAHLDELRNAKKNVRPFDAMLLRARAGGLAAGEREASTGMETFPPGMLDGADLAALVKGATVAESKAAKGVNTTHPDDDLDRSTQPFAEERSNEPHQQGALEGTTPRPPDEGVDVAAHRRRSAEGRSPGTPTAANRPMWMFLTPIAAIAAAALLAVGLSGHPLEGPGIRTRGAADLELRVLENGAMRAWDGKAVAAGTTVGFAVAPGEHHTVVVVSVDSAGHVSTWVPASGSGSATLGTADAAIVALDASVTLDATPGDEVFVAVFDQPASDVVEYVESQFKRGGTAGVAAWADKAADADAVVVEKR